MMEQYKIYYATDKNELVEEMLRVWKSNEKSSFVGFSMKDKTLDVGRLPNKGECLVQRIADFGSTTIHNQYAQHHNLNDMTLLLSFLKEKYGKDNSYTKHILQDCRLVANCSFLMRWSDFRKLCMFLSPVHEVLKEKAPNSLYYLSERLISAWITTKLSPYVAGRNVAIVHYNTPLLLDAAICSLMKNTAGCHVYVFDNSDKKPYKVCRPNVEIIDNTKQQLVNFDEELEKHPDKWADDVVKSNYGSMKHTMSVDKLMELIPEGFVLMDSDVLVKEDIRPLWDKNVACAGSERVKKGVPQLEPFLCWLNVPILKENGISYYNGEKMWALSHKEPNQHYETGAWLLEQVREKHLPATYVNVWKYIIHYGHGSWRGSRATEWLEANKSLYE